MKTTYDLKERWEQIKSRLRRQYYNLNDEDLRLEVGYREELIRRLQMKLGKSREDVERMIEDVCY